MKLIILLTIVATVNASAGAFSQKITLSKKDVSLETIFKEIEKQTGYDFLYNSAWMKQAQHITIDVKDSPLESVLDLCFKDEPFTYTIAEKTIVLKKKTDQPVSEFALSLAPPEDVRGKITDSLGNPLNGAFIQVEGTNRTVSTDENGDFVLKGIDNNAILVVSFVGYGTRKVQLGGRAEINIGLQVTNKELSQVTVSYNNGYQRISPEKATGSFAYVDNKLFNRSVGPDVLTRLDGNVPGMSFNKNTYAAGAGQTDINIQGHSTLFSIDQPLIVVDNFPYTGSINDLNPNDVESVTVLKDAVAASIYGVRSGNGVIVITTKRGKRGQKVSIDFNVNTTIGEKPNLFYNRNFLNSNDYININQKLFDQGVFNGYLAAKWYLLSPVTDIMARQRAGAITFADATSQINALRNQDVRNDLSKYMYQKLVQQQYALSMRGGGQNNDYFASFGYDQDKTNMVGNTDNRVTINTNYNIYPTRNLQISLGMNYIQTNAKNNSPLQNMTAIDPYISLRNVNGTSKGIPMGYAPSYVDSLTNFGYLNWKYKPLDELRYADNRTRMTDNRINFAVKNTFFYGISMELNYQYQKASTAINNYYSDSTYTARNLINMFTQGSMGTFTYPLPMGGILQSSYQSFTSHQGRLQLNFNHNWNSIHEVAAIAGIELRSDISEGSRGVTYGYDKATGNSFPSIDFSSYIPTNPTNATSRIPNSSGFSKTTNNFVGYFGNATYTYGRRYTGYFSGRVDHSNLFGVSTNQKAVLLYSAGFGWDITKEKFYDLSWLPVLRFRPTYGYNANINTSATAVTTISQSTNSDFNGLTYADIASLGNPNLSWEKVRKVNLGLDFGLKEGHIAGSFDYYSKKGLNLFGTSPLAPSTGVSSFFGNTAGTKGHGFDLMINSRNIVTKNFEWVSNLIFSHAVDNVTNYDVKATVTQYLGGGPGAITPIVGAPVFAIYSFRWAGLTHDAGDPQGFIGGKPSTDYNTILNNASFDSLQLNGTTRPTFFGSFRNTFSYKQFNFSFNISYNFDYYFRRSSMSNADGFGFAHGGGNMDYAKRWQTPGDEMHTNVPSIQYPPYNTDRAMFYNFSSALVDKGDNIRLKDLIVSYDLDKRNFKKFPINSIRIFVYLNNLSILWRANKDKLDPDLYGGSSFLYPVPRTYSFGIKANL